MEDLGEPVVRKPDGAVGSDRVSRLPPTLPGTSSSPEYVEQALSSSLT